MGEKATKVIQPFERTFYFSPDLGLLGLGQTHGIRSRLFWIHHGSLLFLNKQKRQIETGGLFFKKTISRRKQL
jgi:hypothetical protein